MFALFYRDIAGKRIGIRFVIVMGVVVAKNISRIFSKWYVVKSRKPTPKLSSGS
jgi:hypothetical protein